VVASVTRIQWSGPAIRDLGAALEYIALDNPTAATRLAMKLTQAVGRLAGFPRSGRVVPGRQDPILREVVHAPFRVIYRVGEQVVWILAIVGPGQEPDFELIQERGH